MAAAKKSPAKKNLPPWLNKGKDDDDKKTPAKKAAAKKPAKRK